MGKQRAVRPVVRNSADAWRTLHPPALVGCRVMCSTCTCAHVQQLMCNVVRHRALMLFMC